MRRLTRSSLSLFVGLLSSAAAACGGFGQDGLVTVGVRPTEEVAALGGTGGRPSTGNDVMNQVPDGISTTTGRPAAAGATETSAGSFGDAPSAPSETTAGAGGAGSGAAGAVATSAPDEDECGVIPTQAAGRVSSGRMTGAAVIEYDVGARNMFVALRTTLTVPAKPAPNGQIYIWPGLQPTPSGSNLQPIGNGALASVLAWGPLCPVDTPATYASWSSAPMYSNLSTSDPQYTGCHGGKVTPAEPEQRLDIEIRLDGTTWTEQVVNRDTLERSDFSLDLKGQTQGRAIFAIDLQTSNKPNEDVVFTNTVLSMDSADPDACQPVLLGTSDFASQPRVSSDGKFCCIDRIVLRAPGVTATTMDP
jgi:hypothetical protein